MTVTATSDWRTIAESFKAALNAKIPSEWKIPDSQRPLPLDTSQLVKQCGILDATEVGIVSLDATDLRDAIVARRYSAVEVATAYLKAAAIVHQATSCLMDYFPGEALARAAWLDEELERTGKPVGPLHGVPISIKDHLGVKGHEITAGFASWVGKNIAEKDGTMVSILRSAGAVFYCKTTNPQAIMHLETDSFLGPTVNPFNSNLTSGGSSGGEGALIGGGGSVLGVGTDIGGSIRNPAALNGIYGFKPTEMVGQESIAGAIGPMGRSARDMSLFVAAVLAAEPWKIDSSNVGMPWRPSEVTWKGGDKPRIGVMWDDGVVRPQPPMRNALQEAVGKLRSAGFEVVDYAPFRQAEGWEIISSLYFTDGGERIKRAMAATGEPTLPLTKWIMEQNTQTRSALEVFELVKRREAFRFEYNAHFLLADIDVILCPPGPGPAPELGTSKYWGYTSIFNLVDYPSAVFPTGRAVSLDDAIDSRDSFLGKDDREIWEAYDPAKFLNAPLSLQIACQRWEDEKVLAALGLISTVVRQ
ncbi:Putative amidase C550.07 [Saitozyma sp. JCM 24511]|nr:Putative amidase C550.07 [Saitozyma sp. JCM 24511]